MAFSRDPSLRWAATLGALAVLVAGFGVMRRGAAAHPSSPSLASSPAAREASNATEMLRRELSAEAPTPQTTAAGHAAGRESERTRSSNGPGRASDPVALTEEERRVLMVCAHEDADHCSHLEPDPLTLDEMARCGIVRLDIPSFMSSLGRVPEMDADWAEQVGLTEAESLALLEVAGQFRQSYYDDLREHAQLAGITSEFPDSTPLIALLGAVEDGYGLDTAKQSYAAIAKERAGLLDAPATEDLSDADRYARRLASMGDDFESALAASLGAARARELHVAADGWGHKNHTGNTCDD